MGIEYMFMKTLASLWIEVIVPKQKINSMPGRLQKNTLPMGF